MHLHRHWALSSLGIYLCRVHAASEDCLAQSTPVVAEILELRPTHQRFTSAGRSCESVPGALSIFFCGVLQILHDNGSRLVKHAVSQLGIVVRNLETPIQADVAGGGSWGTNFESVKLSLTTTRKSTSLFHAMPVAPWSDQSVAIRRRCVVYSIGLADQVAFEQRMVEEGCETHAFDCTVPITSSVLVGQAFEFHSWCIGQRQGVNEVYYGNSLHGKQFLNLSEAMDVLGHRELDLLRIDIEGFEWSLIEDEILKLPTFPAMLVFELHTAGALPGAVPPSLVEAKGREEVNKLFLKLHNLGYRVVSKTINPVDDKCAEFFLLNVRNTDWHANFVGTQTPSSRTHHQGN